MRVGWGSSAFYKFPSQPGHQASLPLEEQLPAFSWRRSPDLFMGTSEWASAASLHSRLPCSELSAGIKDTTDALLPVASSQAV